MNYELVKKLLQHGIDIENVLIRFSGNEELYISCLIDSFNDTTMPDLEKALQEEAWDDAFTAVHALKGLTGNMGFIALFHNAAEMVVLIREGKTNELKQPFLQMKKDYDDIITIIRKYCI